MAKVTKDTTLGEILKNYSNAKEILTNFGMHCFSCPMSQMETIEEAGQVHGIETEFFVNKLNEELLPLKKEEKKCTSSKCCCKDKKD